MAALPSNVGYGVVQGQFILGVADTATDSDALPDAVPGVGTITFTPLIAYVPDAAARIVIVPRPVTVTLDTQGYIVSPGSATTRGVTLIASDNDAFNPRDWAWRVVFNLQAGTIPFLDLVVRAGVTIDLASYVPPPSAPVLGTAQLTALAASAQDYAAKAAASAAAAAAGPGGGGGSTFPSQSTYIYDSAGNVTRSTEDGVVTTYTYNADGSLHTDTRGSVTRTYTYDGSGNLITIAS